MSAFSGGASAPPATMPGSPVVEELPTGTVLWRVHRARFRATQFNPVATKSPYEGGRFDAVGDGDPYLYAGDSAACAIAEVWDRDIGPATKDRFVLESTLKGRKLSKIRTLKALRVINVSVPAAAQFGQDAWFTTCDSFAYPHTREWADWLRANAGTPHSGFVWRSRRDLNRFSYVFYKTQIPGRAFSRIQTIGVERGRGRAIVARTLLQHNLVFKT